MKKITLLLTAVFVLSSATLYAQQYNSDSDFKIDWDTEVNNGIKITKYVGTRSDVSIPPKIQNNTVTQIAYGAFEKTNITSVIIPNGVTSIGNAAFDGCTRLTSVTIPNSVTSIGYGAFGDCTRLTSVAIPNGVKAIGTGTFKNCTSLTSVTIGNSVKVIGLGYFGFFVGLEGAFQNCTSLTSVTIPNSVTSIEQWAFSGCTNLTSVTFKGRPDINNLAFQGNLPEVFDGLGTYTRFAGGEIWKPNFTAKEVEQRQNTRQAAMQEEARQEAARQEVKRQQQEEEQRIANSVQSYINSGDTAFSNKDYHKAISDYTSAIATVPKNNEAYYNKNAEAYNKRGSANLWAGYYDQAIADYDKAIDLVRNNDPNLARMFQGDFYRAAGGKTDVQREAWQKYHSAIDKVLECRENKKYDDVIKYCNEALQINLVTDRREVTKRHAELYFFRAEAYFGKRKYKEARADLDTSEGLDPSGGTYSLSRELNKKGY